MQTPPQENDMKSKHQRKQYVVNRKLQWRIAWQVIITWVIGAAVALIFPIAALFICGMGFAGMSFNEVLADVSKAYTFPILMSAVFMPIAIWHSFQFSNRIAGPMFRFQREAKRLLAGESIKPIKLREKDYWKDFASDLNTLAEKLGQIETAENNEEVETSKSEPERKPELVEV